MYQVSWMRSQVGMQRACWWHWRPPTPPVCHNLFQPLWAAFLKGNMVAHQLIFFMFYFCSNTRDWLLSYHILYFLRGFVCKMDVRAPVQRITSLSLFLLFLVFTSGCHAEWITKRSILKHSITPVYHFNSWRQNIISYLISVRIRCHDSYGWYSIKAFIIIIIIFFRLLSLCVHICSNLWLTSEIKKQEIFSVLQHLP